jgi:signal transduction histidine kinase
MLFSAAILLFLWLLQIVFLNGFYRSMKQQNITRGAQEIAEAYSKIQGEELQSRILAIAEESDLSVNIADKNGNVVFAGNPAGRDYNALLRGIPPFGNENKLPANRFFAIAQQIISSSHGEIMLLFDDKRGRDMLLFGKTLYGPDNTQALLIASSPLQPLDETISILGRQYIFVTIIMLLLSLAFSLIIAQHVSRPIIRITKEAKRLAEGDFDMTFKRGEYSEVDQLADTLNYATKGIKQAETMRNELVANISHDLRTPLTMIRVYAEMIRDIYRDDPASRDENVSIIIEETDRLNSLVRNILELSRLQAGADVLKPAPFDLTQTVRSILRKFEIMTHDEGYQLNFLQNEPFIVQADEGKIELVLYNLLSNAVHYTGDDKQIHVAIADKGEKVRVLIRDTGAGIAPENIAHIWERYYKEGKEHKRAITGTGLGLSIVKSILTMHGMDYGVDSVEGEGSTFWFELHKA